MCRAPKPSLSIQVSFWATLALCFSLPSSLGASAPPCLTRTRAAQSTHSSSGPLAPWMSQPRTNPALFLQLEGLSLKGSAGSCLQGKLCAKVPSPGLGTACTTGSSLIAPTFPIPASLRDQINTWGLFLLAWTVFLSSAHVPLELTLEVQCFSQVGSKQQSRDACHLRSSSTSGSLVCFGSPRLSALQEGGFEQGAPRKPLCSGRGTLQRGCREAWFPRMDLGPRCRHSPLQGEFSKEELCVDEYRGGSVVASAITPHLRKHA